jgi:hypothetical protein
MATFTEAQMREAIETEIRAAAPLAKVFRWWGLGWDDRTWPGLLVSSADSNRVHGYVITRRRTYAEREQPNCVRRFFTYQIRGLRWYDDDSKNAASSDLIYNAELDAICERFANRTALPRSINRIAENSELDFTVDLNLFGAQLLHRAVGSITIEQC